MSVIFLDLNVRDEFVSTSTDVMLEDTKVVVQGIWRLINTVEGEVPFFRAYGLDLKQFCQYPLTQETANLVYTYVENKIKTFEQRGELIHTDVSADFKNNSINMTFYIRVKSTGDIVQLPTWSVTLS